MNIAVFHGSPRKGNTYFATQLFMNELLGLGDVNFTEFFMPKSLPEFCTGCQLCLSSPHENCPHSRYVNPILDAIISADALIFTTPHFGACSMSGGMKNLLDHLDFLTLNITPRRKIFDKKAFIITTGSGSTAAVKQIRNYLKNWGINRVYSIGIRMFTNKWALMSNSRKNRYENKLRRLAKKFYFTSKKLPYLKTIFMYYMSKFVLKKYVREGAYPFEYWKKMGYLKKRPF